MSAQDNGTAGLADESMADYFDQAESDSPDTSEQEPAEEAEAESESEAEAPPAGDSPADSEELTEDELSQLPEAIRERYRNRIRGLGKVLEERAALKKAMEATDTDLGWAKTILETYQTDPAAAVRLLDQVKEQVVRDAGIQPQAPPEPQIVRDELGFEYDTTKPQDVARLFQDAPPQVQFLVNAFGQVVGELMALREQVGGVKGVVDKTIQEQSTKEIRGSLDAIKQRYPDLQIDENQVAGLAGKNNLTVEQAFGALYHEQIQALGEKAARARLEDKRQIPQDGASARASVPIDQIRGAATYRGGLEAAMEEAQRQLRVPTPKR
jgi:hypothetical protein